MCDKAIQIDYISMSKDYALVNFQQQNPDQFRPYGKSNRTELKKNKIFSFRFQSKCNEFEKIQKHYQIQA